MNLIKQYDRPNLNRVHPAFVTFQELKVAFQLRYPYLFGLRDFEKELHDLWILGCPDPNPVNEGRRLILPGQIQKFCREVAGRAGIEIMKNARTD